MYINVIIMYLLISDVLVYLQIHFVFAITQVCNSRPPPSINVAITPSYHVLNKTHPSLNQLTHQIEINDNKTLQTTK